MRNLLIVHPLDSSSLFLSCKNSRILLLLEALDYPIDLWLFWLWCLLSRMMSCLLLMKHWCFCIHWWTGIVLLDEWFEGDEKRLGSKREYGAFARRGDRENPKGLRLELVGVLGKFPPEAAWPGNWKKLAAEAAEGEDPGAKRGDITNGDCQNPANIAAAAADCSDCCAFVKGETWVTTGVCREAKLGFNREGLVGIPVMGGGLDLTLLFLPLLLLFPLLLLLV